MATSGEEDGEVCEDKEEEEEEEDEASSRRFAFLSSVKKIYLLKLRQEDFPFKAPSKRLSFQTYRQEVFFSLRATAF